MIKVYGSHDEKTVKQLQRCVDAEEGAIGVLCADGHLGYSMPIGGVVGYKDYISPSGVGYDIGCGNMAVQTNLMLEDIEHELVGIADEIQSRISFGVGRKNSEPVKDHMIFDIINDSSIKQQRALLDVAKAQLGTVGSGNHYVDIFYDTNNRVWAGVHFGSRGFGHKTAKGFMSIAQGHEWEDNKGEGEMESPPLLLNIHKPAGQDYTEAMGIAGGYAIAGREVVIRTILDILGAKVLDSVHNHHNFAWQELHSGKTYWVVRKGATPAQPMQRGFVGGSMGDISVILHGRPDAPPDALYSTVHGAGRLMSRTQAAGKQKWTKASWSCGNYRVCDFTAPIRDFERGKGGERPDCPKCGNKLNQNKRSMARLGGGLVDFDLEKSKLRAQGIILRGAGADEAPPVYRPLQSVLDAHKDTIEVETVLHPIIVVMAGSDEFDPYKD